MRAFGLSLALVALFSVPAAGAPGDQWILGIHHIDNSGTFVTYVGAGYSGPQSSGAAQYVGNSYGRMGNDGVARVYWELSGNSVNNGDPVPTTTELYRMEFFGTTDIGHDNYQPVESQFHGVNGETFPHEPSIPWVGQFGTNHQWVETDGKDDGQWHVLGPGPQADLNPPADGTMLWLTAGSWLYAKWDFGFPVDRTWSALRLTQIARLPPPPVPGDYNKNGVVDAADYVLWRETNGQSGASLAADGNGDGFVDDDDYDYWRKRFGNTSGTGAGSMAAVPEPTTLMFATLAAVVCVSALRSRRGMAFSSK